MPAVLYDREPLSLTTNTPFRQRRVVLGDPSLISYSGHCLEYIASLVGPFRANGFHVEVFGNRAVYPEVVAAMSATPAFTYWCDERPVPLGLDPNTRWGKKLVRRAHETSLRRDFAELDRRFGFMRSDILVLNTLRHWGLRGLVDWLEWIGRERAPQVVLILHFTAYPSPEVDDGSGAMYRDAFRRIENSPLRDRFILFADAEGLIAEYRRISSLDFRLAPIPHSGRNAAPVRKSGPITMAYAGEARHHKGFHLLPWMIAGVRRSKHSSRVRFNIQNFCHDPYSDFYRSAMAKIDPQGVKFFPKQLDEVDYQRFLDDADVVLIPYLLDNYHVQTSGIYAEAVAMGRPVVVSRGTWMADRVAEYGGGVTFPPNDPQGFLEACVQVVESYEEMCVQAAAAARRWKEFHNPENFVSTILDAADK